MTNAEKINAWLFGIGAGVIPATIQPTVLGSYGGAMIETLKSQIEKAGRPVEPRTNKKLYFSEIGGGCFRKTWYKHNMPDHGKALLPHARIKFMYGDQAEALVLALAKASGLNVQNEQAEVEVALKDGWVLRGRIDCTIDDTVVDVKSSTSRGFSKFREGKLAHDDPFGYKWQLGGYAAALGYEKAEFLALDKELGHLVSYQLPEIPSKGVLIAYANGLVDLVSGDEPPAHTRLEPVAEGKKGNMKLCTTCSYCPFNEVCWRDSNGGDGLRTFLYSTGPVSFVKIVETPRVSEI